MIQVLFENSNGKTRTVGEAITQKEVFEIINQFLNEHNYKSYYMRTWKTDDKTLLLMQEVIQKDFISRRRKYDE